MRTYRPIVGLLSTQNVTIWLQRGNFKTVKVQFLSFRTIIAYYSRLTYYCHLILRKTTEPAWRIVLPVYDFIVYVIKAGMLKQLPHPQNNNEVTF